MPEVGRFAYPSTIKPYAQRVLTPDFVNITVIFLVQEPIEYRILWNQVPWCVMQMSKYRKWKRVLVGQAWKHSIIEQYMYKTVAVDDTVFLMWLMLKYYLQILAGHFVMQMRKIPEVKLFAYPSTIKLSQWKACLPNFVYVIIIVLVRGSKEKPCSNWFVNLTRPFCLCKWGQSLKLNI